MFQLHLSGPKADSNCAPDGYTVDVSPQGCLARVSQHFVVGQCLQLINLANQNVWTRQTDACDWELGLELCRNSFKKYEKEEKYSGKSVQTAGSPQLTGLANMHILESL